MKSKTAAESQNCSTPAHAYLGHFRKAKYINAGHNTVVGAVSGIMEKVGRALNTDKGKSLKDADKALEKPAVQNPDRGSSDGVDKTMRRKVLDREIGD